MLSTSDVVALKKGVLLKIDNLVNKKNLNGQFAIFKKYHEESKRVEVIPQKGDKTLALKPSNLTRKGIVYPGDKEFEKRIHEAVAFWPGMPMNVQHIVGWPTDWTKEKSFIKKKFKWKNIVPVSGIEGKNSSSPDFVMYFDNSDTTSPVNETAMKIISCLPSHELQKLTSFYQPGDKVRGVCFLLYSPTISMNTVYTAEGGESTSTQEHGSESQRYSLKDFLEVLLYHHTDKCFKTYAAHNSQEFQTAKLMKNFHMMS